MYLAYSRQLILEVSDSTVLGIQHILRERRSITFVCIRTWSIYIAIIYTSSFLVTIVRADGSRLDADKTSFNCASCKS